MKIYTIIFGLVLSISNLVFCANESQTSYGYGFAKYGHETIEALDINGMAKLDGTTVKGALRVRGSLEANQATIGNLDIIGGTTLSSCLIENKSKVVGFLSATSSQFLEELTITSEKVVFDSCVLSSLNILKVPVYPGKQIVELKNGSKVEGSILFEKGNGEVRVDATSKITGEIVGGILIIY